jgi:hypothetical protein
MTSFDQLQAALKRLVADIEGGKNPLDLEKYWEVYGNIKSGRLKCFSWADSEVTKMNEEAKMSMMLCSGLEPAEQEKVERLDGPISAAFIGAGKVVRICQGRTAGDRRFLDFCGPAGTWPASWREISLQPPMNRPWRWLPGDLRMKKQNGDILDSFWESRMSPFEQCPR